MFPDRWTRSKQCRASDLAWLGMKCSSIMWLIRREVCNTRLIECSHMKDQFNCCLLRRKARKRCFGLISWKWEETLCLLFSQRILNASAFGDNRWLDGLCTPNRLWIQVQPSATFSVWYEGRQNVLQLAEGRLGFAEEQALFCEMDLSGKTKTQWETKGPPSVAISRLSTALESSSQLGTG